MYYVLVYAAFTHLTVTDRPVLVEKPSINDRFKSIVSKSVLSAAAAAAAAATAMGALLLRLCLKWI